MDTHPITFDPELLRQRQAYTVAVKYLDVEADINQAVTDIRSGGDQCRSATTDFIEAMAETETKFTERKTGQLQNMQ